MEGFLNWIRNCLYMYVVVVVVVCRDPAYSGSTAYADFGNIYSLYYNTVKKVTTVHKIFSTFTLEAYYKI